jgi:hypothetical protein
MVWTLVAVLAALVAIGAGLLVLQVVWTRRRLDLFRCKIRLIEGWLPGYSTKWPRLAARATWEHDVLIVYRGLGVVRVEGLPVACAQGTVRTLPKREVSRLGRHPVGLDLVLDCGPRLEVAVPASAQSLLCGPYLVAEVQPDRGSQSSR